MICIFCKNRYYLPILQIIKYFLRFKREETYKENVPQGWQKIVIKRDKFLFEFSCIPESDKRKIELKVRKNHVFLANMYSYWRNIYSYERNYVC